MKPEHKIILAAVERTDEWAVTRHMAIHNPSKTSFWIANGFIGFSVDSGTNFSLGIWFRLRLWLKVKKLMLVKAAEEFYASNTPHNKGLINF